MRISHKLNLLKEYASVDKNRNGNHHGSCTRSLDDDDDITGSCTGNELYKLYQKNK